MCLSEKKDIKWHLSEWLVKPFKSMGIFGRQRFCILYLAYRLTGWHIRHKEWDFVLEYLPKLAPWQKVRIVDVGCSRNLIAYEFIGRGYSLVGVDIEEYCENYPGVFVHKDIRKWNGKDFDFATCISVLEHIDDDQERALHNMINSLKIGGRLLLTIPTKQFAQGHVWYGFSYQDVVRILPENSKIIEYTEKAGQICLAIERI